MVIGNADKEYSEVLCRTDQGSMFSLECTMYSLCSCFASRETEKARTRDVVSSFTSAAQVFMEQVPVPGPSSYRV